MQPHLDEFSQLDELSLEGSFVLRVASLSGSVCFVKYGPFEIGNVENAKFQEVNEIPNLKYDIEIGFLNEQYALSKEWEFEFSNLMCEFVRRVQEKENNRKRSNQRGKKKRS